jgi:hypothetical protein
MEEKRFELSFLTLKSKAFSKYLLKTWHWAEKEEKKLSEISRSL